MKKKVLELLATRFGGVNEAILGRIAERIVKTTTKEEDVEAVVNAVTLQELLENYGNSRATEASLTAVTNYERKHGLKDGKAVQPEALRDQPRANDAPIVAETQSGGDAIPKWARELMEREKALTARLATIEGEKITAARREVLGKLVEKLPEALRKPYARTQLDNLSEADFDGLKAEVAKEVEAIAPLLSVKDAVFTPPLGGAKPLKPQGTPQKEGLESVLTDTGL